MFAWADACCRLGLADRAQLMFAPRDEGEDPRHVDSIWPIWSVLDMTPAGRAGRGTEPAFPRLRYD